MEGLQRRAFPKPPAEGGWNLFCTALAGLDFFTPATNLAPRADGEGAFFGWLDDPKIEELREASFNAQDLAEQKNPAAGLPEHALLATRDRRNPDGVPP